MSEWQLIRKQLLKNMLYNLVAFTILFSVFGITIFSTVKTFLYQSSTNELLNAKEHYNRMQILDTKPKPTAQPAQDKMNKEPKNNNNPRIIYIKRDINGNVINQEEMGSFYDNYIEQTKFDSSNLDKIVEVTVNNSYTYRSITFATTDENGEEVYVQLLINIDSEKNILENFFSILSLGIVVTIILAIFASYILSKNTLKPIIDSWRKQTEFVQNASHELRTPLTIIQAKQELLLQEPESKIIDKSEDIRLTLNETKRLSKLTKDLMLLARADSNQIKLNKEEVDIDQLIREITVPYKDYAAMQEKTISLKLSYSNMITVDTEKIHQLLVILLDNAIKYTKEGEEIEVLTYSKDNKCVIEVRDTGIGISKQGKKHIFERFYREDKARSRKTGGTGLGLSIAYFIVESHGGTIKVEDNEPKGSVFIIKFPKQ